MKKGILLRQRDATDCGAVCLASIAAYFELRISVSRVRQLAGTDKRGTSMFGLLEAAKRLDFQARGIKTLPEHFGEIPLPAIFHLILESGMQHFVVVYRFSGKKVCYMDPASGEMMRKPLADFQKAWSGAVLILIPEPHFRKAHQQVPVFTRFRKLIRPHRSMLLQALLGAAVYTVLGLSGSVYVEKIIDFVLPDANRNLMNLLGLGMLVILIFQMLTGYLKSSIALQTGQQMDAQLILGYYRHLLRLPQLFFDNMRVGEILSRVNDAVKIRSFINDTALYLVIHLLTMIFSLAAMFVYYWKLALVMLLMIPLYFFLYFLSNRINARGQREIMETGAMLESQLVESIRGMGTIKKFGVEEYFNRETEKKLIPLMHILYKTGKAGLRVNQLSEFNTRLLTIAVLWIGSYFVMDSLLSPGALLSFYALTGYFTTPVQALIGANRNMQDALIAADRLFEIIDLEIEKESPLNAQREGIPVGNLEYCQVHFRYGSRQEVFRGLDLVIEQGQITAILGESGSGKSTLFLLMQRLYPLNEGRILLAGRDIEYISPKLLRHIVAPVPQHTDLFQGTILSNIALGEEEPEIERVYDLCSRLGLHEFIERLPGKYHFIIGEQGNNLSGGQKQRIAIARAMYRNPEILILDEATASLDPASERKVQETIHWFYQQKKTVVMIAHRLSTIRHCHRVLLLKEGKLVAAGPHDLLMRENEAYINWWKENG